MSDKFKCWCGVVGDADHMFMDTAGTCGGTGVLNCYCGGDLCVCHNHGEVECAGCDDCSYGDDDYAGCDDDDDQDG